MKSKAQAFMEDKGLTAYAQQRKAYYQDGLGQLDAVLKTTKDAFVRKVLLNAQAFYKKKIREIEDTNPEDGNIYRD